MSTNELTGTCKGCGITYAKKRSSQEFHDEACYARYKRRQKRLVEPAKTTRTFTCVECNQPWQTEELGHFSKCPSCKEKNLTDRRTKVCQYRHCGQTFLDNSSQNSSKFCNEEHRRREKMFRSGKAQAESYFRINKPKMDMLCMSCNERWVREPNDKANRCPACRKAARNKVCRFCNLPFFDTSLKNNRQAHPSCIRRAINVKVNPIRSKDRTSRLQQYRTYHTNTGLGGRLDDITTISKKSGTWYSRVAELIFARYYPDSIDQVTEIGSASPYDFLDCNLGKVDVKSAKQTVSPFGKPSWKFGVDGVKEACNHLFALAYSTNRSTVDKIWLIPASKVPDRLIVMTPESNEYAYKEFEVGTTLANETLQYYLNLPEKERPKSKYSWMDDPNNLSSRAPGHRGRRGELIYQLLYPNSKDMNSLHGYGHPYDFEDTNGNKVNVKTSYWKLSDKGDFEQWSFMMGNSVKHTCDTYSCLCLDQTGTLVREYRIPSDAWGDRRTIHIYNDLWSQYRVPLQKEGLKIELQNHGPGIIKDKNLVEAEAYIKSLDRNYTSLKQKVVDILQRVPFPTLEYSERRLSLDFNSLVASKVSIENDSIIELSNAGLIVCNKFFPHRYDARYKTLPSVRSAWGDPVWLKKAVDFQMEIDGELTPWAIYTVLRGMVKAPTNFRPTVAKAIIEHFTQEGQTILDPCAGYGGRALAALATARGYVGIDPHPAAKESFQSLFDFVANPGRMELHNVPFEDIDLGDQKFDFAFTSPPYFSVERYSDDDTQSWVRYPTWELWRDRFLTEMIKKVRQHLDVGSYFCLNVANIKYGRKEYPLVSESVKIAETNGFEYERAIQMPLSIFGNSENPKTEPILVLCAV